MEIKFLRNNEIPLQEVKTDNVPVYYSKRLLDDGAPIFVVFIDPRKLNIMKRTITHVSGIKKADPRNYEPTNAP